MSEERGRRPAVAIHSMYILMAATITILLFIGQSLESFKGFDKNIVKTRFSAELIQADFEEKNNTLIIGRTAMLVYISRSSVLNHFNSHSTEFLASLGEENIDLVYVVANSNENTNVENTLNFTLQRFPQILLIELDENNPFDATTTSLRFSKIGSELVIRKYDFVVVADRHTYVHPPRIAGILKQYNPNDPIYVGRPMRSCLAQTCPVHCSGKMLIISKAVLHCIIQHYFRVQHHYMTVF